MKITGNFYVKNDTVHVAIWWLTGCKNEQVYGFSDPVRVFVIENKSMDQLN